MQRPQIKGKEISINILKKICSMRKFLLLFYIVLHTTASFCQNTSIYLSVLNENQREFRDYLIGVKKTEGDSLLLRTEPVFDKVYFGNSSILGKISFAIRDIQHVFLENCIWVCMDKDFRLKFIFPIGTEDVGFCDDGSYYNYTTHISTSGDYWYNVGVVDDAGEVVLPAMKRNELSFSAGVFYSYEWDDGKMADEAIPSLQVTVCDTKTEKVPLSVIIAIPCDALPYIEAIARGIYVDGSLSDGLNDYCEMLGDFMSGCDLSLVMCKNQLLTHSNDPALAKVARINKKPFRIIACYLKKMH